LLLGRVSLVLLLRRITLCRVLWLTRVTLENVAEESNTRVLLLRRIILCRILWMERQ
jgi:hypothetical protein